MKTVLLSYSIVRKEAVNEKFYYDHMEGLNIKNNIPFIDSSDKIVSLMTKTEALRESDDTTNF